MKSRRDAALCLGYLAIAAAFFKVGVLDSATNPSNLSIGDMLSYYYPMLKYGFGRIRAGHLPLWDPYQSCGTPLLASAHFGFAYPLYATFLVLPPELAINLDIILHLTIASAGTYLLCRHLRMRRVPSFIAGIVYAYHGSMMAKLYFTAFFAAVTWIPLLFLLVDRVLWEASWRTCAALAVVVGLALLSGHGLQFNYFEVLALLPWVVVRSAVLLRRRGAAGVARAHALLAVAAGLGTMVALVRLIPTAEFVSESWRAPGLLGMESVAIMSIAPGVYVRNLLSPGRGVDVARQIYVGTVPLALAVTGLVRWKTRSVSLPVAAAGIAAVLYAFGPATPFYRFVYHLPAGNWFRGPDRALVVCGFAVALLCGAGVESVLRGGPDARARLARLFLPAVALGAILVLNVAVARADGAGLVAVYALSALIILATIILARGAARAAAVTALAALVLFDLCHAQRHDGLLPSRAGDYYARLDPTFDQIRRRQGLARTYIWESFDRSDRLSFLSDLAKAGLNHGIWMVTDYEPLGGRRMEAYMDLLGPTIPIIGPLGYRPFYLSEDNLQLVELMGVRYFMVGTGLEGPFVAHAPTLTARWRLLLTDQGVSVYEDPGAMERCFIVNRVEVERDEATLLGRLRHEDLRHVALIEETPAVNVVHSNGDDARDAHAEVISYTPENIAIDAVSDGGFLVLTDRYYPGWQAWIDGVPSTIYRTDYLFRGLPLPPGRHRIELAYRPRSVRYGAAGTVVGLLGIAVVASLGRRRTKT